MKNFRFSSIGSGSKGNASLVQVGETCLMVDCGFSLKQTVRRLQARERGPSEISGILLTHEHSDHIRGVSVLSKKYNIPVWSSAGTAMSLNTLGSRLVNIISSHQKFRIGEIEIDPFPVPHDAREPTQFIFSDGRRRLGLLTDTGSSTPHILKKLNFCDAMIMECNHDENRLAGGAYPESLKRRISGRQGHLSNNQAADILKTIDSSALQHVVAAHISKENNSIHLAKNELAQALDWPIHEIMVADQDTGFDWQTIH